MANEMNAPLVVRDLCKNYPGFQLKPLSFMLEKGKITGFIGRNGAGKTTTINAVLSLIHPDGGEVYFSGLSGQDRAREILEKIGFVSAGMTFYTRKKLKTITAVTKSFYPGWDDAQYRKHMTAFGLSEDKTPAELSNGMKIKYALAIALSHGAELLILDEPTSGLDPVSRDELTEIFLRLRDAGKTIFFSTHITSDLDKCADRILFLQNGELKADADLNEFRKAWRIVEFTGPVPEETAKIAQGICRIRDGHTVLLSAGDADPEASREATLEEIMVHLEREENAL